jgi:hypothetical protein
VHRRVHRGLVDGLRSGALAGEIPTHGTTTRVRQSIPEGRWAGVGADGLAPELP